MSLDSISWEKSGGGPPDRRLFLDLKVKHEEDTLAQLANSVSLDNELGKLPFPVCANPWKQLPEAFYLEFQFVKHRDLAAQVEFKGMFYMIAKNDD